MIASSYTLAAIVTSLLVVVVGMPLGRRKSILLGNITIVVGGIIQATSFSVPQIIVARVICVCRVWSFWGIHVEESLTLKH